MPEIAPDPGILITAPEEKPSGVKLTPVEGDPFASDKGPKLTPVEGDPFATDKKTDDSFLGGMKRGFLERGTGVDQLLNDMGVGGHFPVFVNGKLSFGLPPNEELAQQAKRLEEEGKGTGVEGAVAEFAGDPLNLLPYGKAGLITRGGIQGALSGATAPTADAKQGLAGRAGTAALGGGAGALTGGALGLAGAKTSGTQIPMDAFKGVLAELGVPQKGAKASALLDSVKQMGLKFTGKEKPEEVYAAIKTAVQDKVNDLAEKQDPGSSVSRMWSVSTNLAVSTMYQAINAAGSALYKKAEDIGKALTTSSKGLSEDLGKMLEDVKKDTISPGVNPKFATAVRKLEELQENIKNSTSKAIGDDPWSKITHLLQHGAQPEEKVNGAQLIELDQALNELYGSKGQGGAAGKLYSDLQKKVNDSIQSMSPEFGAAYQKAKDFWRTKIIHAFDENKALHAFWKPEDFKAFQDIQKGLPLHPNVKTRVEGLLDKVKTWNDLDVLKGALPPQMYNTVRAHKFISLMEKAGIDAKAFSDEKNYAMIAKALGDKPEDVAALDAIKTFVEQMQKRGVSGKFSPEDLKESDKLMDRSVRTVLGFATRHKLYGLSHAWDLLRGRTTTETEKGVLKKLAIDAAEETPKDIYQPGTMAKVGTRVLATEEGEAGK